MASLCCLQVYILCRITLVRMTARCWPLQVRSIYTDASLGLLLRDTVCIAVILCHYLRWDSPTNSQIKKQIKTSHLFVNITNQVASANKLLFTQNYRFFIITLIYFSTHICGPVQLPLLLCAPVQTFRYVRHKLPWFCEMCSAHTVYIWSKALTDLQRTEQPHKHTHLRPLFAKSQSYNN